jgi:hypothetical protein
MPIYYSGNTVIGSSGGVNSSEQVINPVGEVPTSSSGILTSDIIKSNQVVNPPPPVIKPTPAPIPVPAQPVTNVDIPLTPTPLAPLASNQPFSPAFANLNPLPTIQTPAKQVRSILNQPSTPTPQKVAEAGLIPAIGLDLDLTSLVKGINLQNSVKSIALATPLGAGLQSVEAISQALSNHQTKADALNVIQKGMQPMSHSNSLGQNIETYIENVDTGVKNIFEAGAQAGFNAVNQQDLNPVMSIAQKISDVGKDFRASDTGKFVRGLAGYSLGQTMTNEQFQGGLKNIEKAGVGLVVGTPESVAKTTIIPGKIMSHALENNLSGDDITSAASFGIGVILPTVFEGSGLAVKGIAAKSADLLGLSDLNSARLGYVAEKIPQAAGLYLGYGYAKDLNNRIRAPIDTGETVNRPSTPQEIADYKASHPNETYTGNEQWTTPESIKRSATDMEMYRRAVDIGSTELVPMALGSEFSPKFADVKLPTEASAKLETMNQDINKLSLRQKL